MKRSNSRLAMLLSVAMLLALLTGCGQDDVLVSVAVSPANASATSGTSANTVQFTATGQYAAKDCGTADLGSLPCTIDKTQALKNATWSTSDATDTTVSGEGLATCISPTATPAKIIASAQGANGLVSGGAKLTCN